MPGMSLPTIRPAAPLGAASPTRSPDPHRPRPSGRGWRRPLWLGLLALVALLLAIGAPAQDDETAPGPGPDIAGLKRDTLYFLGYQVATVAVLYALPAHMTNFDRDNASFDQWRENVTNPQWDDDQHVVNYLLHPYWGAAYYVRGRERRLDRMQAFWYGVLLSTLYEFGAEAMFEPVSYQDLVVTPVAGWLLGEYVFMPLRASLLAQPTLGTLDRTLLVLTDPLGTLNGLTDRLFGVPTQLSVALVPSGRIARNPAWQPVGAPPRPTGRGWELRLELRW
ncbi:DUF3943 domain-containing protein [Rivibacter subsaxonicus]|uniref:Uncharacterized protein DUF3943 n=1 Tax=Rivibacter subsaxonicus TaxID=457575 RepID=A0A4Q7W012_9BURK|nr:DUF3943 domain-containing protein [Rivibacter subsaxonicus]RZU02125.1 uncharacterized protein DUF3943 [Rivibacter subsaxonicus]